MRAGLAVTLVLGGCYDFNADLATYCSVEHENCPLPCPDGGICTLARQQPSVYDATLHNGTLYWAQDSKNGSVWMKALSGGDPTELITGESYPISVVADDSAVYWATSTRGTGTINKYSPGSGLRSTLSDHQALPCRLRLNANTLYWSDHPDDAGNTVTALDLNSGTANLIASGYGAVCHLTIDGDTLFWADSARDGGIYTLGTGGGQASQIAGPVDFANAVAADATNVYWVVFASSGSVWRALRDGGSPTQLVGNQLKPASIVTDGVAAYYGTFAANGQVLKVSVNGGEPTVIASNQIQPLVHAVDDEYVYWSTLDADGGLFRAPK